MNKLKIIFAILIFRWINYTFSTLMRQFHSEFWPSVTSSSQRSYLKAVKQPTKTVLKQDRFLNHLFTVDDQPIIFFDNLNCFIDLFLINPLAGILHQEDSVAKVLSIEHS